MTTDLILRSRLSPGDHVVLTAAIRDLQTAHPGRFRIDVDTPHPEIFAHNPHLHPLTSGTVIDMAYPLIQRSNTVPLHFIHGYRLHLEEKLGVSIPPGPFRGDIHLSYQERQWKSQVEELDGDGTRFWIIVSGGKRDFTAKWWDPARWQAVVDHFRGRIRFVQVGAAGDEHPPLSGVLDLRGKTNLRQLIRLVYHADGVLCPVTSLMHLAAAVPWKHGDGLRPCVVVAGGREPVQWEAYPGHRYLDTIGALPCCDKGGCWKSRVTPLGDNDEKDKSLCLTPAAQPSGRIIPACLDRITAADVIRAVESYLAPVAAAPDTKPTTEPMPCTGCTPSITTTAADATDPAVWGPKKWREFHHALRTKVKLTKSDLASFLDSFTKSIPCDECREHFRELIEKNPVADDVFSQASPVARDELEEWGCRIHELVNVRLGKPPTHIGKMLEAIEREAGVTLEKFQRRQAKCKRCPYYGQATADRGPVCNLGVQTDLFHKLRHGKCNLWISGIPITAPAAPVSNDTTPAKSLTVGVVIGTFGLPGMIRIQLAALAREKGVRVLVVDDGSGDHPLAAVCNEYKAELYRHGHRLGHIPGDLHVFRKGLEWARKHKIDLLVKLSRRFIPTKEGWIADLLDLHREKPAPTYSNICRKWGFGFRSECVAIDVRKWTDSNADASLPDAIERAKSVFVLAEKVIHDCAGVAWRHSPGHPSGNGHGFVQWPMMGESKAEKHPEHLWHETHDAFEYVSFAAKLGISVDVDELAPAKRDVLIRRKGALGDVLCITPIVRFVALRIEAIGQRVDVATDCPEALDGNPHVRNIYPHHHSTEGYARVIDLNNAYEREPKKHIVDAYALAASVELRETEKQLRFGFPEYYGQKTPRYAESRRVLLHCAKSWESRTIPRPTWDAVATKLSAWGMEVCAIGTAADYCPPAAKDMRNIGPLATVHKLMLQSFLFIGSDSALLHLAGTTEIPIVGIYTCAHHDTRKPLRQASAVFVPVFPPIDCYGCLSTFTTPVNDLPHCKAGDLRCIRQVTADQIIEAIKTLLAGMNLAICFTKEPETIDTTAT